ncbi:MAG: hypothetical protein ACYCZV_12370 [Acidimicrobiales bacterium]
MDDRAVQAACNNAFWCDAVCRSHGLHTTFQDGFWLQADAPLPLYPNIVTTAPEPVVAQTRRVEILKADAPDAPWSVKDSFGLLELESTGMRRLFEAEWVHREPLGYRAASEPLACQRVDSPDELAAWESAWGQRPEEWSLGGGRVFQPSLLADPDIAPIAVKDGGVIVAGLIANRAADAIGFSNGFARIGSETALRVCIDAAGSLWPGLPLVGYTGGEAVEQLEALGFARVGPLRIWVS